MGKGKKALSANDKNLSEIIADHNPLVSGDSAGNATASRGYQKSND